MLTVLFLADYYDNNNYYYLPFLLLKTHSVKSTLC
jgi:hypothetical protein